MAGLAALVIGARLVAQDEAGPVTLTWPEVAGCPTRAEVVGEALRLIVGGVPQAVRAAATVTREAAGWRLALVVEAGGTQRRELVSADCAALGQATAVILAVAAEPLQVAAHIDAPAVIDPVAAIVPVDEVEVAPGLRRAAEPPEGRQGPQIGVFVHGGAGLGPSPRLVPGVVAGVAVLWPRVRLELRATMWGRAALRLDAAPRVGADLRLATGGLRGCPVWVRGSVTLQLCAGVEFGATIVDAVGLAADYAPRSLWAAVSLAPGLRWRPRRWVGLALEVEGLAPLVRKRFMVAEVAAPLHETPALGLRVLAGVEFNFF